MVGLGTLIMGLIFGGSYLSAAKDNREMMKEPHEYMPDGTPIYLDRKCRHYINGEQIVPKYDYATKRTLYVGKHSGNIIYDPEQAKMNRMDAMSEKNKEEAIAEGMLAYKKYNHERERFCTAEISTGRYIAQLELKRDGTAKKWYLYPEAYLPSDIRKDDPGIDITPDEYRKLNVSCSSHLAFDFR